VKVSGGLAVVVDDDETDSTMIGVDVEDQHFQGRGPGCDCAACSLGEWLVGGEGKSHSVAVQ